MNAVGEGSVQGFRITGEGLRPLKGSHRSLGLDNEATPRFDTSPGEAEFTPDGRDLVVTTKARRERLRGWCSVRDQLRPEREADAGRGGGEVHGHLVPGEARRKAEGAPRTPPSSQETLCRLERAGDYFYGGKFVYVQNAVSGTVDGFRVEANGALTKVTTAEGLPAFGESGMEGIAV
ncbi:hypothetical protein QF034_007716 [Streptomyces africanus]|uniref:Uncharacterized protein n=1 Tax=Streptomyces africanus TaxID=231024 RepID=A0ABU0R1E8_9ACTN|nr:hypothetical protein [Streptomyces africanus]MDQ0753485.1 hypothetical protein [Streptomyces africanus]